MKKIGAPTRVPQLPSALEQRPGAEPALDPRLHLVSERLHRGGAQLGLRHLVQRLLKVAAARHRRRRIDATGTRHGPLSQCSRR